jgi:hypothetical protein
MDREVDDDPMLMIAPRGTSWLGVGALVRTDEDVVLIATGCAAGRAWVEIGVALLARPEEPVRRVPEMLGLEIPTWLPMPDVPMVVAGTSGTMDPPAVVDAREVEVTPDWPLPLGDAAAPPTDPTGPEAAPPSAVPATDDCPALT